MAVAALSDFRSQAHAIGATSAAQTSFSLPQESCFSEQHRAHVFKGHQIAAEQERAAEPNTVAEEGLVANSRCIMTWSK
jgi:hypothetical protein